MSLLGLDIGTSAVKGLLLDDAGGVLGEARRGYSSRVSAGGRVELDPMRVWHATRRVIRELAATGAAAGSPVRALCAGGSGDEVIALDRHGRVVAPVIMALDDRSAEDGAALAAAWGRAELVRRTGLHDHAASPLARWRWMGRCQPAVAARVTRLLSWPEWTMTRLGLPALVDPTLAARTLAFDISAGAYVQDWLVALGGPDGLLSPIVPTGSVAGPIPARIAQPLGLRDGVRYVVGGFDQAMATLGAGVTDPRVIHDGTGSWEAVSARLPTSARSLDGWSVGPSVTGSDLEAMTSWPGGLMLGWVSALAHGGHASDRAIARSLASLPPDLPRLAARLTSHTAPGGPADPGGAIVGLDLSMGHGELVLGVLVGLVHRLRRAIDDLQRAGVAVRLLRVTGGGARSDRWLQLKADATGIPVERLVVDQAGAFAAAVLAGSGIGVLPSPGDAIAALARVATRSEPDPAARAWHDDQADAQARLSDALDRLAVSWPARPPS